MLDESIVMLDDSMRMMLGMIRAHNESEPRKADYPEDDGHAQAAYWRSYDEWAGIGFGLRMMVGGRLITLALRETAS